MPTCSATYFFNGNIQVNGYVFQFHLSFLCGSRSLQKYLLLLLEDSVECSKALKKNQEGVYENVHIILQTLFRRWVAYPIFVFP